MRAAETLGAAAPRSASSSCTSSRTTSPRSRSTRSSATEREGLPRGPLPPPRRRAARRDPDGEAFAVGSRRWLPETRSSARRSTAHGTPTSPAGRSRRCSASSGSSASSSSPRTRAPSRPSRPRSRRSARALRRSTATPTAATSRLQEALAARHGVARRRGLRRLRAPTAASTCSARRCSTPATRSSAAGPRSRATRSTPPSRARRAVKVPLREGRYDLEALAAAVGPRTKLVYVCHPNNPTGTMNSAAELDALLERASRPACSPSSTRPTSSTSTEPDYPDAVERYLKAGRARRSCCAPSRRSTGSPGLRVGYAVAPADVCAAMAKLRRPFDLTTPRPGGGAREPRRPRRDRAPRAR